MKRFFSDIKDNWILLGFLAALITWYANTNSRLTALAESDVEQKAKIQEIYDLKTDIAVIKSKVDIIYERVK